MVLLAIQAELAGPACQQNGSFIKDKLNPKGALESHTNDKTRQEKRISIDSVSKRVTEKIGKEKLCSQTKLFLRELLAKY